MHGWKRKHKTCSYTIRDPQLPCCKKKRKQRKEKEREKNLLLRLHWLLVIQVIVALIAQVESKWTLKK